MQFFPEKSEVIFEKSATYFDKDLAAKQAYSLLPNAKIIIILLDPISRAHSWYQVSSTTVVPPIEHHPVSTTEWDSWAVVLSL